MLSITNNYEKLNHHIIILKSSGSFMIIFIRKIEHYLNFSQFIFEQKKRNTHTNNTHYNKLRNFFLDYFFFFLVDRNSLENLKSRSQVD